MSDFKNKPEPKKIKLPPLVDRSEMYDRMTWREVDDLCLKSKYEDYNKNNSEGLSELESL